MVVTSRHGRLLRQLLPPGRLFTEDPTSNLQRLLDGLGAEFDRIDEAAEVLPEQLDPSAGFWSLDDWERVLGLPDECGTPPETAEGRRAAILGRLLGGDNLSRDFLQSFARKLGYAVSLEEGSSDPFVCGESRCGDALGSEASIFDLRVRLVGGTRREFTCGLSVCGDPLVSTTDDFLQCALDRVIPAHVGVTFEFADDVELYLEVSDELGGTIRVFAFGDEFYVVDENGDLIRIPVVDDALAVIDEDGNPISIPLQQEPQP